MKTDKIQKAYDKMLNDAYIPLDVKKDANKTYQERYKEIQKHIKDLLSGLKKHSSKQAKNPADWGYAGDLGYINDDLLKIIINFKF